MYNKKKCVVCNKIFYKKRNESIKYFKNKKTCSNKCRFEYIKGKGRFGGGYSKICKYCKNNFFTYDKTKKFCKKICYNKWLKCRDKYGNLIIKKMCLCGCIKKVKKGRKFYSLKCYYKYINKNKIKKKCKYCNKKIYISNYNKNSKKFCKKECYTKWQKNRNRNGKFLKNKKCKYCGKKIAPWRIFCNFRHYKKWMLGKKLEEKINKCDAKKLRKFFNKKYNKRYGIKRAIEIRLKQRNVCLGEKNYKYKNGKSQEPYDLRFDRYVKEQVKKRDKNICQLCFKRTKFLGHSTHCHHINYNKKDSRLINLILLHNKCNHLVHRKSENKDYYFSYFCYLKNIEPEVLLCSKNY